MIETTFTPVSAAIGGAMIGTATVMLLALRGNVFGATGILAGVLNPMSPGDWAWRVAILAGLITGPLVYLLVIGQMPAVEVPVPLWMVLAGGFLGGVGVTFGSGCTSGHGICGLARGARRSIAATATFMISTGITVYVVRHIVGVA